MKIPKEVKELPKAPKNVREWMLEHATFGTYLIYNNKKGTVHCTRCGNTYKISDYDEIPSHNDKTNCPCCDYPGIYKQEHYGRAKLMEYGRILIFVRKGNSIYATLSMFQIDFTGLDPQVSRAITDIYKLNSEQQLRFTIDCKYGSQGWQRGWYPCKNIIVPGLASGGYGCYNKYDYLTVYDDNFDIFADSDLKYADVKEVYKKYDLNAFSLMRYLKDSIKYRSLELLRKSGFEQIVKDRIAERGLKNIYWRGKDLKKILRLGNMGEVKKWMGTGITTTNLAIYKEYKNLGINCESVKEIEEISRILGYSKEKVIAEITKYTTFSKAIKYLKKQSDTYEVGGVYSDYIKECEKLELNLNDKTILFPRKLTEAHSRTSAQIKAIADAEQQKFIKENAEKMKLFNFTYGNLLIRVAESAEEIILEGKLQGHCVGGYVGQVAKGQTNIFFVRRRSKPDKEYYTLELGYEYGSKRLKMQQCRGKKNCNMTDEVKEFVDRWMAEVVNAKPKKRKKVA